MNYLLNKSSSLYYILRWFILIALGLMIYGQTFRFEFVFDDYDLIVGNPYIKNLDNLHHMWSYVVKTRLIGILSFALNYSIHQLHPLGYHLTNFIIHLIMVGVVWGTSSLLFKITDSSSSTNKLHQEIPFIIAIFFLIHPCQTQAVTYIAQRMESLAALFYMSTLYCYLHARIASSNKVKILLFVLSCLFAVLGIFTKETAVTIPFMILACELILWPNGLQTLFQSSQNLLKTNSKIIYVGGILGALLFFTLFMKVVQTDLSIFFQTVTSDSHDGDILTPHNYFLTQMRVFLTFLRLLILPIQQNLDYDYPMSIGLLQPPLTLVGMLLIGLMIVVTYRLRKKYPLIALGLAWILITFSINLAPRHNIIFEHKLYLISFGFLLAAILALSQIIQKRVLLLSILSVLIITLTITSFYRNQVWKNSLTLWEDVVQKSPNKTRAIANLGRAYSALGKFDKAIPLFNKAINLKPSDYLLYVARASAYSKLNLLSQAHEDLNKVIHMQPNSCSAHMGLSELAKKEKNYPKALQELDLAITLDPSYPEGYILRAHLLYEQGEKTKALKDLQQAANIDPYNLDALGGLAQIHIEQEQYELAIQDLNKAIQINPHNPATYEIRKFCILKTIQHTDKSHKK